MGFALWIEDEVAWAQGRHEYRPMGVAVIAASDLFRPRDFRASRVPLPRYEFYAGLFASLGEVNAFLQKNRPSRKIRSQRLRKNRIP